MEILGTSFSDIENNKITKYLLQYNYSIYSKAINTVIFIDNTFSAEKYM